MPFLRIFLIVPALCLFCHLIRAETFPAYRDTPLVSFKNKPKFFLNLDRSSSFIEGKGAITNELRLGLDFRRKVRIGIGVAGLSSDVVTKKTITTEALHNDSSLNAELKMTYLTISAEYTLYESKRWQVTTPFTTGIGTAYFEYFEKVGSEIKTKRAEEGGVLIVTPAVVGTYRLLRWFGLSAGLGYRQLLVNNSKAQERLNSPVYIIRLRIFMGEIYKTVFPRGITGKKDPPYSNDYWD
jgi:hypothetical protein